MHDVRETFHAHEAADLDRAGPADAPQVVPAEVHEHDVLRPLLGVVPQLVLEGQVLVLVPAAGPGAGDRPGPDPVPFDPDQHLRRGARQGHLAEIDVVHVRRRIDASQGAIDRKRRGRGPSLEALRQDHLEDVARADVVLGVSDVILVERLADVRLPAAAPVPPKRRGRRRAEQQPLHRLDAPAGFAVAFAQGARPQRAAALLRSNVRDDLDPLLQVVERQDRVVDPEHHVWEAQVVLDRARQPLEEPHHVVRQVTDRPSREARQVPQTYRSVPGHRPAQRPQRIAAGEVVIDHGAHERRRIASQERVAGDRLAAFHRLEEERLARARLDAEKGGHRREQVRSQLATHRDDVALLAVLRLDELAHHGHIQGPHQISHEHE